MENFEELRKLISNKDKIEEYLKRVNSIGFIGRHGKGQYIGIIEHDNERYELSGVSDIIGVDVMNYIVMQFKLSISAELKKHITEYEKNLSKFSIVKDGK